MARQRGYEVEGLEDFVGRLDELTTQVLMPLRADKLLNGQAPTELEEPVHDIGDGRRGLQTALRVAIFGPWWGRGR